MKGWLVEKSTIVSWIKTSGPLGK